MSLHFDRMLFFCLLKFCSEIFFLTVKLLLCMYEMIVVKIVLPWIAFKVIQLFWLGYYFCFCVLFELL